MLMVVAVAELIAHALAAALYHMHQMVFLEECQGPEYVRLVDGLDPVLQLCQCGGVQAFYQLPHYYDAVRRRFDAVLLQQLTTICFVHTVAKVQIIYDKRFLF